MTEFNNRLHKLFEKLFERFSEIFGYTSTFVARVIWIQST